MAPGPVSLEVVTGISGTYCPKTWQTAAILGFTVLIRVKDMWLLPWLHRSAIPSCQQGDDKTFTPVNRELLWCFPNRGSGEKVPGEAWVLLTLAQHGRICSCAIRSAPWNQGVRWTAFWGEHFFHPKWFVSRKVISEGLESWSQNK